MMKRFSSLALVPVLAGFLLSGCLQPVAVKKDLPEGVQATVTAEAAAKKQPANPVTIVWDGDDIGTAAKSWANCTLVGQCASELTVLDGSGRNDTMGLKWKCQGKDWKGFGWNWLGWWPPDGGMDITQYKNLVFWIKIEAKDPSKAPAAADMTVGLACSANGQKDSESLKIGVYGENLVDGKWHEIVIPVSDFLKGPKAAEFDPKTTWEIRIGHWSMNPVDFTLTIDDIGFDNRKLVTMISLPEKRKPAPIGSDVADIKASVDLSAEGVHVNPFIYGVSHGDAEIAAEMGVSIRRFGGNTASGYNWKTGAHSLGADWYFENRQDGNHPQNNWWAQLHRDDIKYGMESYMTMPMEYVAKGPSNFGFPKDLYPDCTEFAGDRPNAGNGKVPVKAADGTTKIVDLRCGDRYPSQNGVYVGLEYNVELVKYSIEQSGFGKSDTQTGIKYVCLDNEPMLYTSTHRDIFCTPWSYDVYWDRTKRYAELIRKVDPNVKIAGPAVWGWTAYFYSAADLDNREKKNLNWGSESTWPDYGKYGPFLKNYFVRCAEYKKKTGRDLIDIFDFHGYSCTKLLDENMNAGSGGVNNPQVMEFRILDCRKFWDESYRDPFTWMGGNTDGQIAYVPMMRRWMKEAGISIPISVGEYNMTGWDGGYDISGAVAQAETFGAFSIAQVDYAFYWADVKKHTPCYFAWKMFRNPDGQKTAVGDQFIKADVSNYSNVSVYIYKNAKTGIASFIVLNKKAKKGAKVSIDLAADLPNQSAPAWEFSSANMKCIGELPPMKVGGKKIAFDIAPMSILRFDVKM